MISGDELNQLVSLAVTVGVLVTLIVIANAGEDSRAFRVVAYAGFSGLSAIVVVLAMRPLLAGAAGGGLSRRMLVGDLLELLGGLVAPLMLLGPVRHALGRRLKTFRPESCINAVSAGLYVLVVTFLVSRQVAVDQLQQLARTTQAPSLWFIITTNQLPFLIAALAGVGLFVRRSPRKAAERLGLYWPGWRWIGISVVVAVLLVCFGIAYERVTVSLTPGQYKQINDLSDLLLRNVSTPLAAAILALGAGIGEEILFRGAIQPRLGIVAASLLFAALHTQYAVSFATLEIFILGVFLGLLRKRAGLFAGIIAHAGYDLILLMIPYVYAYFSHRH